MTAPPPATPGEVSTRLRPATWSEQALLAQWRREPASEYDDLQGDAGEDIAAARGRGAGSSRGAGSDRRMGRRPPAAAEPRDAAPAIALGGPGELVVADGDDTPIGTVGWHQVLYGPNAGSICLNIGISLRPHAHGLGHGTRAQRMLADYLFATFPVHRVEASTDVTNIAEQRALERAGFRREGVLRGAQWRLGEHHDLVSYSRLRTDG